MTSQLIYKEEWMFPQSILDDLAQRLKVLEARPAVKVRFYQESNKVTDEEVLAARTHGCGFSLESVKMMLEDKSERRLQYFDEDKGEWVDVPFVTGYRDGGPNYRNIRQSSQT